MNYKSIKNVPVLVTVVVAGIVVVVDGIEADDVTVSIVVLVDADDVIGKVIEFVTDGITGMMVFIFVIGWLVMIYLVKKVINFVCMNAFYRECSKMLKLRYS